MKPRRRKNPSLSPKAIWAGRVKLAAIALSVVLLLATVYFLRSYKPPVEEQTPAVSGTSRQAHP